MDHVRVLSACLDCREEFLLTYSTRISRQQSQLSRLGQEVSCFEIELRVCLQVVSCDAWSPKGLRVEYLSAEFYV